MEKKFILTILGLDELKELGYKEVWIGNVPNPHWPRHGCDNFVIASPKMKKNNWPALWSTGKYLGKSGCGNGLNKADQSQKEAARDMIPGHYKLTEQGWTRAET